MSGLFRFKQFRAARGTRSVLASWIDQWSAAARSLLIFALSAATGIQFASAAQVQHLNTQTATASGAGAAGTPAIASFNIPSGKNRVLFIWPTFERDHCSNADVTGGLCVSGNASGTGLGARWRRWRIWFRTD